jgi:hypothetical protein
MSRYDDGWPAYVPVAERRRQAARAMAKLAKRGHPIAPVKIEGRAITTTFWGNAWCDNLESYRDLENRGGIDSLVELLQGRLSKGVMERICRQGGGLFPKPSEIRFACSCPDYASMCKHVAAVLYGIGARLDREPELLFCLRAVNESDLVARIDGALPLAKQSPAASKVLETDDVAALFGLDMAAVAVPPPTLVNRAPSRPGGKATAKQPA